MTDPNHIFMVPHMIIPPTPEWIADVLARARTNDLTIVELCAGAGITRQTLYGWKAGDHEPTLQLIRRVEKFLGDREAENRREQ